MKKGIALFIFIAVTVILIFSWPNIRKNYFPEKEAEHLIKQYYQSLIQEDYEKAFDVLFLQDKEEDADEDFSMGTTLTKAQARDFYMEKIAFLKEQNYAIKDFNITDVEYSDGHTFWHHLMLQVEINGAKKRLHETVFMREGKLMIGEKEDPYARFRDGKMKIEIKKPE
ncbi:hypothetical protein ERJ70_02355 [Sediminibacillus dalangtanensis]|uniref:SnoaL-like domain-containing protein n=1 Tax=Sediminibacillus dalangtanensis TaxID=2729421 RepID=A0ABX7VN43_9BACI|nr:hypothetical protein [Sediminibacillus dalangtanensis]QTM98257.1 hypothetical protein ERJ70_02355 [Sediminibacillus dalangtanensis]